MTDIALHADPSSSPRLILAFFALASPAPARAGGAAGPLRSGGAAFGDPLPVPDARPIASRLTATPREITAGDAAPVLRLRVRQRGVDAGARADRRRAAAGQPPGRAAGRSGG